MSTIYCSCPNAVARLGVRCGLFESRERGRATITMRWFGPIQTGSDGWRSRRERFCVSPYSAAPRLRSARTCTSFVAPGAESVSGFSRGTLQAGVGAEFAIGKRFGAGVEAGGLALLDAFQSITICAAAHRKRPSPTHSRPADARRRQRRHPEPVQSRRRGELLVPAETRAAPRAPRPYRSARWARSLLGCTVRPGVLRRSENSHRTVAKTVKIRTEGWCVPWARCKPSS